MTESSNQESRSGDASAPDRGHAVSNGAEIAFVDARVMHGAAMARLEAGDIRDAAEKAWSCSRTWRRGTPLRPRRG